MVHVSRGEILKTFSFELNYYYRIFFFDFVQVSPSVHPLLFELNRVYPVIYIIHLISGKVINVTGLENYDIATGVRNIKFIPVVFHVLFPHYSSYCNVI